MPIQPNQFEDLARNVSALYEFLELRILEKMKKKLDNGFSAADWQLRKLADLRKLQEELRALVDQANTETATRVYKVIDQVYRETQSLANGEAISAGVEAGGVQSFGATRRTAVEAYARALTDTLTSANESIFRVVPDAYRRIVSESALGVVGGVQNRIEATQTALNRFADDGISNFVDRAGRRWGMQEYAEMATRSAIMRTSVDAATSRFQELERDLVIISDHPKECPLCRPWERKVLSISGTSEKYPPLARARAAGLFHPNCGHVMNLYTEGLTKAGTAEHDERGYELKQQQRYYERQIRKWKRREAVAITEKERKLAAQKVAQWQGAIRAFVVKNKLDRKPQRERILEGRPKFEKINLGKIIDKKKAVDDAPTATKAAEKIKPNKEPKPKKPSLKDQIEQIKQTESMTRETSVRKVGALIAEEIDRKMGKRLADGNKKITALKAEVQDLDRQFMDTARGISNLRAQQRQYYDDNRPDLVESINKEIDKQSLIIKDIKAKRQIAVDALNKLEESVNDKGAVTLEILKKIRPMGKKGSYEGWRKGTDAEMKKSFDEVSKYIPESWLSLSEMHSPMLGKWGVERGFYSRRGDHFGEGVGAEITVSGSGKQALSTLIHEFGHRMETIDSKILFLEKQFYDRRTYGENVEHMGEGYEAYEVTRPDDFIKRYMGKDYNERAYELLSMGLEYVFDIDGYHSVIEKDADFRQFILGILGAV